MVKVRKLVDKKEKDLEAEIKRMVDRKTTSATQDLRWADEKLNLLDKTVSSLGEKYIRNFLKVADIVCRNCFG